MISPGAQTGNLVSRQLSMQSAMSEDAVPTEDPKNVSLHRSAKVNSLTHK